MGISVKAVTGYFGNTRLAVPPQIISSMHKALKNAGIPVKARELAKHLTFEEAKIVIELTRKAGSEDEKTELTRKLQGYPADELLDIWDQTASRDGIVPGTPREKIRAGFRENMSWHRYIRWPLR
ncbi:MAG: hypothetical protein DRI57_02560 [Deltaproteobacteria bacterium]|nr:MAG: hypothetical protein DRI57_02560 [Deltaproteobacteria bacterium]